MPSPAHWRAHTTAALPGDSELHGRVTAEFSEMPGLKLTVAQAARLFGHDKERLARVLSDLVERGELATDGDAFARPDADRHRFCVLA